MSNPSSLTPAASGSSINAVPGAAAPVATSNQATFGIPDPALSAPEFQPQHPDQYRVGGYMGGGFENIVLLPEQQQHQGQEASGSTPRAADVGAGGTTQDPEPTPTSSEGNEDTGLKKFMRLINEGKAAAHPPPGVVFTMPVERPELNLK
ncbi:hypothetical protein BGW41_001494 [Actinomortierella wolfii]|nr:hypothetical protein BGW41_001494 [Actinomortierella wolfii]